MLQCIETEGEVGGAEILLETLSARDLEIQTLNITILWNEGAESVRAYIYAHIWPYSARALSILVVFSRSTEQKEVQM